MSISSMIEYITDPYERKARLVPGLLGVLPIIVTVVLLLGPKHPYLSTLLALFGGCGAMFALSRIARNLGKRKEGRLLEKWGGLPTTIMLRHRDQYFDRLTTSRYHDSIAAISGIRMPSAEEERIDAPASDEAYRAGVTRVRELTRGPSFRLLAKENANYGFQRNMLGLRPIGVLTCVATILFLGLHLGVVELQPLGFAPLALRNGNALHGLILLVALALTAGWLFLFTEGAVRSAANAYAERLLEAAASLSTTSSSSRKTARRSKTDKVSSNE